MNGVYKCLVEIPTTTKAYSDSLKARLVKRGFLDIDDWDDNDSVELAIRRYDHAKQLRNENQLYKQMFIAMYRKQRQGL